MDITNLRQEIDSIDSQLVELYKKRMEVAGAIADYKKENGLSVRDAGRERKVLSSVSEQAGEEFEEGARALFSMLMELSRAYQHKMLEPVPALAGEIANAAENTQLVFPKRALVACQGVEGAYSQQAAEKLFAAADIMYFSSFEGVFQAVEKGLCKYGVLPLENSTAGSVNRIYDLMQKHKFYIVRSARLHVGHCLLGKKGASLKDIREVFSHQQALSQCGEFLHSAGVKVTECENTAEAARMVAASDRSDIAAISSASCAELYGLDILSDSVTDSDSNYTRFICISKKLEIYPGADRTSLMLSVSHKPGSLYMVLSKLYAQGINLVKLESRPIPGKDFEFMFYFDLDASVYSPALGRTLGELEADLPRFQYLGSYSEVM